MAISSHARAQTAKRPAQVRKSTPAAERADLARFRARLAAVLSQTNASRLNWGMEVADRDTGQILFDLNADHFFTPASNAKIVTTTLALASLGSDFRFHTTLESKSALDPDGRIVGDLILIGRGDPDLSNRRFPYVGRGDRIGPTEKILAELTDAAVAKGLRAVDGDIVADDSYYPYDPYPAGWSIGDLFFSFAAPVSAIAFNDNTVSRNHPSRRKRIGDPAIILTEPAAALGTFAANITTGPPDTPSDFRRRARAGRPFHSAAWNDRSQPHAYTPGHRYDCAGGNRRGVAQTTARSARRARHGYNPRAARRRRHIQTPPASRFCRRPRQLPHPRRQRNSPFSRFSPNTSPNRCLKPSASPTK